MSAGLPIHPVPASAVAGDPGILVDGLVARRLRLDSTRLRTLPRRDVRDDFVCEEGWTAPSLSWGGVQLADAIALADPLPAATHVRVCAGGYAVPLDLAGASSALLCDLLDGAPLAVEHGGPWRLLLPGERCFTSVKWVDRLELVRHAGDPSGERIARARLGGARPPLA